MSALEWIGLLAGPMGALAFLVGYTRGYRAGATTMLKKLTEIAQERNAEFAKLMEPRGGPLAEMLSEASERR